MPPKSNKIIMLDAFYRPITEAPEGARSVRVMGPQGDVRVVYEPASQEQVDAVVRRILDLKKQGYGVFGFTAGSGLRDGAMLQTQDIKKIAEFERVVVAPPMAGG